VIYTTRKTGIGTAEQTQEQAELESQIAQLGKQHIGSVMMIRGNLK
jgi:hypothetical protein